jgi:hypothetical protein
LHRPGTLDRLLGAWLSLAEHSVWDREVAGSNPAAPTYLPTSGRADPPPQDGRERFETSAFDVHGLLGARRAMSASAGSGDLQVAVPTVAPRLARRGPSVGAARTSWARPAAVWALVCGATIIIPPPGAAEIES